jgi:hypothetical protein
MCFVCSITKTTHTHFLIVHGNNSFAKAPQCHVRRTLPLLVLIILILINAYIKLKHFHYLSVTAGLCVPLTAPILLHSVLVLHAAADLQVYASPLVMPSVKILIYSGSNKSRLIACSFKRTNVIHLTSDVVYSYSCLCVLRLWVTFLYLLLFCCTPHCCLCNCAEER